jgi:hypothetical protein
MRVEGKGFWGFGVLGFWGFGVSGFRGFGVLGFWGFGVLGSGVLGSGFWVESLELERLILRVYGLKSMA